MPRPMLVLRWLVKVFMVVPLPEDQCEVDRSGDSPSTGRTPAINGPLVSVCWSENEDGGVRSKPQEARAGGNEQPVEIRHEKAGAGARGCLEQT